MRPAFRQRKRRAADRVWWDAAWDQRGLIA
jgi:hypothetical protein